MKLVNSFCMDVKIRCSKESKTTPKRKSSFRRMYEVCDRMVQQYFNEGGINYIFLIRFFLLLPIISEQKIFVFLVQKQNLNKFIKIVDLTISNLNFFT